MFRALILAAVLASAVGAEAADAEEASIEKDMAAGGSSIQIAGDLGGWSVWEKNDELVRMRELVRKGDADAISKWAMENPQVVHMRSGDGRGPLWWAHEDKKPEIVSLLISQGADPHAVDVDGKKPGEAAPPAPGGGGGQLPVDVLGTQLLTKSGPHDTAEVLKSADLILLYFSEQKCPACHAFTHKLASAFKDGSTPPNLAAVFVSGDSDDASFQSDWKEMPWHATPLSTPHRKSLETRYGVTGYPSLVVLNGRTGAVISADAREYVQSKLSKGSDLQACMRYWGVAPAPAVPAQAAPASAAPASAAAAPAKSAALEGSEPAPAPVDDAVLQSIWERVAKEPLEVQDVFFSIGMRVLNTILQHPGEKKYRTLKRTNPYLSSKFLGVAEGAGTKLALLAGFVEATSDELTMPAEPDGRCTEVRDKMKSALENRDAVQTEEESEPGQDGVHRRLIVV